MKQKIKILVALFSLVAFSGVSASFFDFCRKSDKEVVNKNEEVSSSGNDGGIFDTMIIIVGVQEKTDTSEEKKQKQSYNRENLGSEILGKAVGKITSHLVQDLCAGKEKYNN